MTLGTRIAIRSRPPKQFGILIDEPARPPHGNYLESENSYHGESFTLGNPETEPSQKNLAKAGGDGLGRRTAAGNFRNSKELIYGLPAVDSLTLGTRIAIRMDPTGSHLGGHRSQKTLD